MLLSTGEIGDVGQAEQEGCAEDHQKKKAPMDFQQKFLPRELDVMKMLDHPHIIKLYDILYINDKVTFARTGKFYK